MKGILNARDMRGEQYACGLASGKKVDLGMKQVALIRGLGAS